LCRWEINYGEGSKERGIDGRRVQVDKQCGTIQEPMELLREVENERMATRFMCGSVTTGKGVMNYKQKRVLRVPFRSDVGKRAIRSGGNGSDTKRGERPKCAQWQQNCASNYIKTNGRHKRLYITKTWILR
jgi:hypothetical protein